MQYLTSLYWTLVTVTTVGYGDILPVSKIEKTMITVIMILGTVIFSIYVSILATLFSNVFKKENIYYRRYNLFRQMSFEYDFPDEVTKKIHFFYKKGSTGLDQAHDFEIDDLI